MSVSTLAKAYDYSPVSKDKKITFPFKNVVLILLERSMLNPIPTR